MRAVAQDEQARAALHGFRGGGANAVDRRLEAGRALGDRPGAIDRRGGVILSLERCGARRVRSRKAPAIPSG